MIFDRSVSKHIPVAVYDPPHGISQLRLRELWEYRELLYFLVWRDIKVRYKQAVLGASWALIQPLVTIVIFSVIFGQLAKLPSDGVPYPVFSFAGLLPWMLFSSTLSRISSSLVGNSNLLTKVYFPRLIIPLSALGAGLVDFGVAFVVLLGMMLYYGIFPTLLIVFIPLLTLLVLATALAVGLWCAALNVRYRDVQQLIPFLLQVWMYISPVAYSISLVPQGSWRLIYGLNPMTGVIQGFRWALLGGQPPDMLLSLSCVVVLVVLISGLMYFLRVEQTFADIV